MNFTQNLRQKYYRNKVICPAVIQPLLVKDHFWHLWASCLEMEGARISIK